MPDHGKLMHLFLIQEPKLTTFAHLHPSKRDRKTFEATLPNLYAGTYRIYADVTYETGFSDTFATSVDLPAPTTAADANRAEITGDPDDSWKTAWPLGEILENRECDLGHYAMLRSEPGPCVAGKALQLQFQVKSNQGEKVTLEPYLGMRGHLTLRRDDGSVFTHLHPGGSASMAALQLSVLRAEGKLPLNAAFGKDDPICELPSLSAAEQQWLQGAASTDGSTVAFPYAFPKPGRYRLWAQVKIKGEVLTGVYDIQAYRNSGAE